MYHELALVTIYLYEREGCVLLAHTIYHEANCSMSKQVNQAYNYTVDYFTLLHAYIQTSHIMEVGVRCSIIVQYTYSCCQV